HPSQLTTDNEQRTRSHLTDTVWQGAFLFIVDAHLDLAYNAVRGRQVHRPAIEQTPDGEGVPTVGLPDLRKGGVGLICATIFCQPALPDQPGYETPEQAATLA